MAFGPVELCAGNRVLPRLPPRIGIEWRVSRAGAKPFPMWTASDSTAIISIAPLGSGSSSAICIRLTVAECLPPPICAVDDTFRGKFAFRSQR